MCDGARNLLYLVQLSQKLPKNVRRVTQRVLQRNGFWAHHEHILLSMLTDDDTGVREHAANHILAIRARGVPGELRRFVPPKNNFRTASLTELVQWDEAITEPPLTMELSDSDLRDAVEAPLTYPPYICHSQAVERWVAEVTEAAGKKVGHDARHRFILARARSRAELTHMETKRDFHAWTAKQ